MKKIAWAGVVLASFMVAGNAAAVNSLNQGTMGVNISLSPNTVTLGGTTYNDPMISGKYFVARDAAILAGFGFSSGGTSGASVTLLKFMGGFRKYLKTEDFSPFVGGRLDYASVSTNPTSSKVILTVQAGAEYFLSKQFSVEGNVGFGFESGSASGVSNSYIGSNSAAASVNFYF